MPHCTVYDLGLLEYGAAFDLQKQYIRQRLEGVEEEDRLLLLEHPPVYTIGRAGGEANIRIDAATRAQLGIARHEVDRGGDVTYHGPGQLVGYPLLSLTPWGNDVRRYVRMLEEVGIVLLAELGLTAGRKEGLSGVWIGQEKICAIGVKVNRDTERGRFLTSHGFAFNNEPDLSHFGHIVPCGITEFGVTSLAKLGLALPMDELKRRWTAAFAQVFEVEVEIDNHRA